MWQRIFFYKIREIKSIIKELSTCCGNPLIEEVSVDMEALEILDRYSRWKDQDAQEGGELG